MCIVIPAAEGQSGDVEKLIGPIVGAVVGVGLLMTISVIVTVAIW